MKSYLFHFTSSSSLFLFIGYNREEGKKELGFSSAKLCFCEKRNTSTFRTWLCFHHCQSLWLWLLSETSKFISLNSVICLTVKVNN